MRSKDNREGKRIGKKIGVKRTDGESRRKREEGIAEERMTGEKTGAEAKGEG